MSSQLTGKGQEWVLEGSPIQDVGDGILDVEIKERKKYDGGVLAESMGRTLTIMMHVHRIMIPVPINEGSGFDLRIL